MSSCRSSRRRRGTRLRYAPSYIDRVNAPTLTGATGVAGHPPAQPAVACENEGQVDHGRDKALRVATPSLTASNRTTPIGADRAVISAHNKAAAGCKNILKRIPAVSADLQHAAVEAEVRILARRFKIEVVPESQRKDRRKKKDG